jgi:CBS domain containing-hemolysin-like protein
MGTDVMTWLGIALLVLQSGAFSGLNLALFGVSALRLRTLANTGNEKAATVLMRYRLSVSSIGIIC